MIPLPKNTPDETGRRYGSLVVMEYAGREESKSTQTRGGHALWKCACDCGRTVIVRASRLREGRIVSCGCWRANPAVRQAAAAKVSPRRRRAIARMGGQAKAQSKKKDNFSGAGYAI